MPYIDPERRKALWSESIVDYDNTIKTAGELNFWFTEIIQEYIKHNGLTHQKFNDIIGALEGAKLELYSRIIRRYEDLKIQQNGDVYQWPLKKLAELKAEQRRVKSKKQKKLKKHRR